MRSSIVLLFLAAVGLAIPAPQIEHEVSAPRLIARQSNSCHQKVMDELNPKDTQDAILYNAGQSCMAGMNDTSIFVSCVTTASLSAGASPISLGNFLKDLLKCSTAKSGSMLKERSMHMHNVVETTSSCEQGIVNGLDTTSESLKTLAEAATSCLSNENTQNNMDALRSCVETLAFQNGVSLTQVTSLIQDITQSCSSNSDTTGPSPTSTMLTRTHPRRQASTDTASCLANDGRVADLNTEDIDLAQGAVTSCSGVYTAYIDLYNCIVAYVNDNDHLTPPRKNGIVSVAFQCSDLSADAATTTEAATPSAT